VTAAATEKARFAMGVYTFTTCKQMDIAFDEDPRLQRWIISMAWSKHLKRDYSKDTGVQRLGYKVIRPVVLMRPRENKQPNAELLIECDKGYLSREEAIGDEWIPTPSQIAESAKLIRDNNEAIGNIRRAETVGFDLQRVVHRPMLAF